MIAAVAGDSDCAHDLVIDDEGDAAFDWNRSRRARRPQTGSATGNGMLEYLGWAFEHGGSARFLDRGR